MVDLDALPGLRNDLPCGECGTSMVLRLSKYGLFYGCPRFPQCRGTHCAHPDGAPIGIPCNAETKRARMAAHAAFDGMWKAWAERAGNCAARNDAYAWLRLEMGLTKEQAHIGRFDKEQCARVVELVKTRPMQGSAAPAEPMLGAERKGFPVIPMDPEDWDEQRADDWYDAIMGDVGDR